MKPIFEINKYGCKVWYLNDLRHREDGPAYEGADGTKFWYLNGELHREDGPSIEFYNGYKEWFYHGKRIECKDNEEFLRMIKLMVFL
tara:strand:- start:19764 stop:20024 length:261 start_codon:yes stop_codon:yes gene_type:complete